MTSEHRRKPRVSTEFVLPDGTTGGTRSLMVDFQTLRARIFGRIIHVLGQDEANRVVLPGINAFNCAEYEDALAYFTEAASSHPEIAEELRPHILICKRVIATVLSPEDIHHRNAFTRWERLSKLFRLFLSRPVFKIRCKYCGHYTRYIDPEKGLAYFGTNNCDLCGRGYPVPDFAWDGVDGKAYIYYRNSVTERNFYEEFETEYEVSPDHTHFLKK